MWERRCEEDRRKDEPAVDGRLLDSGFFRLGRSENPRRGGAEDHTVDYATFIKSQHPILN